MRKVEDMIVGFVRTLAGKVKDLGSHSSEDLPEDRDECLRHLMEKIGVFELLNKGYSTLLVKALQKSSNEESKEMSEEVKEEVKQVSEDPSPTHA